MGAFLSQCNDRIPFSHLRLKDFMTHLNTLLFGIKVIIGRELISVIIVFLFPFYFMVIIFFPFQVNGQPSFLSFSPYSGYAVFIMHEVPTTSRKSGTSVPPHVTHLPVYQILVSQRPNSLGEKIVFCKPCSLITSVLQVPFISPARLGHTAGHFYMPH